MDNIECVFRLIDRRVDADQFLHIYIDSFPDSERRPIDNLMKQIESNEKFNFYGLFSSDKPVGFITTWNFDDFIYVEHLAVDSAYRGAKFGSKIIEKLKNMTEKSLILEVEILNEEGISTEEQNMREARVRFYNRLGFIEHKLPYVQPPYTESQSSLPLMLMECQGGLLPDNFLKIRNTLYHYVYGINLLV